MIKFRLTDRIVLVLLFQLGVAWLGNGRASAAEPSEGARFQPVRFSAPSQIMPSAAWRAVLSRLPQGNQQFGGVAFQVDAPLEVLGLDAARQGEWVPPQSEVFALADSGKLGSLYLLHGLIGEVRRGTPVMAVAFHYSDGAVRLARIAAGVHLGQAGQTNVPADPHSQMVWAEAGSMMPGSSAMVCLTRLENPRPGQVLRGIQFVSMFSDASPLVLAATWESGTSAARPARKLTSMERRVGALSDDAWRQPVRVKIAGQPGADPVTNAQAFLSISDGEVRFLLDQTQLNAAGEGTLYYPPAHTVSFDLVVRAPGKAPMILSRSREADAAFPEVVATNLSPGLQVGGIVEDDQGKPIAGASVTAYLLTSFRSRSWGRADMESTRTDGQGRWSLSSLPLDPEGVDLEIVHPAFVTRRFRVESTASSADRWSRNALVERSALAKLESAPQLTLTVRDALSKPAAQVLVSALKQGRLPVVPLGRTDTQGTFTVSAGDIPAESGLLLEGQGFAPHLVRTSLGDSSESVSVSLIRPVVLKGMVLDQQGLPVPGVEVRLETWNETPLFSWKGITDDQGRFAWSNAAPGSVMLRLSKSDYQQNRYSLEWNTKQELRLTMYRNYTASGTVTDATTGKPIRDFRVLRGWSYSKDSPIRWERYNTFRGRNGAYSVRLQNYGSSARLAVMIEAPGYQPVVSQEVTGIQSISNSFDLHPARGLSGTVVDPSGNPVANATLTLVGPQESVFLEKPGPPSRSSNHSDQTRSDAEGRFEFQPRLFVSRVVAVHDSGFADLSTDELKSEPKLKLRPYGRIEGTFRVGGGTWKPTMQQLRLQTFWLEFPGADGRLSATSLGFRTIPDTNGHFVFEKVPPGLRQVSLEYKFTNRRNADTPYSHDTMVNVLPGETAQVVLGGAGRLVRGRVRVSGADPEMIDWMADVHRMTWLSAGMDGFPVLKFDGQEDSSTKARKFREYQEQLNGFMKSPEGVKTQSERHNYALVFRPDGTFEVENVMPGRYSLQISPYEHDPEGYNSRQLGYVSHEIQVPEGGSPTEPFDAGAIDLAVRGVLKAGRKLPEFQVEGIDGKSTSHESLRGKVAVIYFWSTGSMNDGELKMLRDLLQAPENDQKIALLMWNTDGDKRSCQKFVEAKKVPGMVCALDNPIEHPFVLSLGIENYPSALVVDASGRITGVNLRGNSIRSAVTRALRPSARR